jgi:hypothetical protein
MAVLACALTLGVAQPAAAAKDTGGWVKEIHQGAGLTVSFEHPLSWRNELPGQGFHYSATFAYLANFRLNSDWCSVTPNSETCLWAKLATFPANGVLMTYGTDDYGPGATRGLGPGRAVRINGRSARVQSLGSDCSLGTGSNDSLTYTISSPETQGHFFVDFCFSGPDDSKLRSQAQAVVHTLTLALDPSNSGVQP